MIRTKDDDGDVWPSGLEKELILNKKKSKIFHEYIYAFLPGTSQRKFSKLLHSELKIPL